MNITGRITSKNTVQDIGRFACERSLRVSDMMNYDKPVWIFSKRKRISDMQN